MNLPIPPPVLPMLAKRIESMPPAGEWIFEPKWDGFRVLVFRDHEEILLQSRESKSFNRYFPELMHPLLKQLPSRCVLDGEIVIARGGRLDFDALQQRIHPAAARVEMLACKTPASIVFFDLLGEGNSDLRERPFRQRRAELQKLLARVRAPLHITPATTQRALAQDWFRRFEGAGLDGVVAKSPNASYQPDKRVMLKMKHLRECDCVVGGFRWYKEQEGKEIGSLLLGLYDEIGSLQHVGVCAGFPAGLRREWVGLLKPYQKHALTRHPWRSWASNASAEQRMPGAQSRWSAGKDLSWVPVRPELVIEVGYDHMQSGRFRHMTQFHRWRIDRLPSTCTFGQLEVVPPEELAAIFASAA